MKTPTAHPNLRRLGFAGPMPLRARAELPTLVRPLLALHSPAAGHDFLVPNPRPDLVVDTTTLRMIER